MSELATACYCGSCPTCNGMPAPPTVADPLLYRHGAIKQRLLMRIGTTKIDGSRPLEQFTTRDDDDPAIALIDAFAGSLHILAWNTARLSDDGALPRTEDRDALTDLTRLVGYEPRPALAATTTLAFTLDDLPTSPKRARIPKGTKVASVPAQDEKPQIFETDAEVDARADWNQLKPVLTPAPQAIGATTGSITIVGVATLAKTGDLVLVDVPASSQWLCARIANVVRHPDKQAVQTRIDLVSGTLLTLLSLPAGSLDNCVVILGQRAAAFGATAPDLELMSEAVRTTQAVNDLLPTEWKNLSMPSGGTQFGGRVDLDAIYPDAVKNRFVFFSDGTHADQIGHITAVSELSRKGFGLAAKVTRIQINGVNLSSTGFANAVRETAIWIETAREKLLVGDTDAAMPNSATPDRVIVQGAIDLPIGRRVVLTGERWGTPGTAGAPISEAATLKSSAVANGNTLLVFEQPLVSQFRSLTLSVLGNCVSASHGETPVNGAELIGSGKASTESPRFQLKAAPLAYVPATNPRGYAPAIEVRIDDRLYGETPAIFGLTSADRAYTVKTVRNGKSEVQFAGRLPGGTHNVNALYRVGGGVAGNLDAGRITTVLAPVIGVRSVHNPVAAEGGSDAETVEDSRVAAPQSIRTLDRVVSLADFAAFAHDYRGIGKAIATELHVGMRSVVCITIATTALTSPIEGSDIFVSLRDALALVAPPGRSIRIEGFVDLSAQVTVALLIDRAFRRADVEAAVRAKLGSAFGRAARNFGEALHRSAVLATVQSVDGVIATRLMAFLTPNGLPENYGRLLCPAPTMTGEVFSKAGLLSIDPATVQFTEMAP
jgi:hypothetical protein